MSPHTIKVPYTYEDQGQLANLFANTANRTLDGSDLPDDLYVEISDDAADQIDPSELRDLAMDKLVLQDTSIDLFGLSGDIYTYKLMVLLMDDTPEPSLHPYHNPPKRKLPKPRKLRIAVLFDGAGLARLGLEQAGHECVGFELDPDKHHLSQFVGSGNSELQDVTDPAFVRRLKREFNAVWASPPCPPRSVARMKAAPIGCFSQVDLTPWALALPFKPLWVENVLAHKREENTWGRRWNADQFTRTPFQGRQRIIGGNYDEAAVEQRTYRSFSQGSDVGPPCITGTEYKGCATDRARASRWYGRRISLEEAAFHQGFKIPPQWWRMPRGWEGRLECRTDGTWRRTPATQVQWERNLYQAIGNGVPVYMAYAFGAAYSGRSRVWPWTKRWERAMRPDGSLGVEDY